jgi:hypothetical protein
MYDFASKTTQNSREFARICFTLTELEASMENVSIHKERNDDMKCVRYAELIMNHLKRVGTFYRDSPEQKSVLLLLVMEVWMQLEKAAVSVYPLLRQYLPPFPVDILDPLLLHNFRDMQRLRDIRVHPKERHDGAKLVNMTIFDDPVPGCFAEKFYDQHPFGQLQDLHDRIIAEAEELQEKTELEWEQKCAEFERLHQDIADSSCIYEFDEFLKETVHAEKKCTKCYLGLAARRLSMQGFEYPLPADQATRKAVVFELACPIPFAAYREATWGIVSQLGIPDMSGIFEPHVLLPEYSELRKFSISSKYKFSLGSTTKSFLNTHYANPRFPVKLAKVCLPNGLALRYYDAVSKIWPGRVAQKATFLHHCRLVIPPPSPFALVVAETVNVLQSSNEIIVGQTRCPAGLNVHEFLSFQTLLSGKTRRWPQILMELGSSNLNFSTESTMMLISYLSSHAGPAYGHDILGVVHRIFRDGSFCERLLAQISQRVNSISSSWRETVCMEMLIHLVVRLISFRTGVLEQAIKLLDEIRKISFDWIVELRKRLHATTDTASF